MVKSQAVGYWGEASFIPRASDARVVDRVIARFLDLQGDSYVGGLVFREYIPLRQVAGHAAEWRAFILDGKVVGCWPRGHSLDDGPPQELLAAVAAAVPSRFVSADFARREDGGWLLLEIGDGQVSGIPDDGMAGALLSALAPALA